MKYKVCTDCGSHLDHGERCDCRDSKPTEAGENKKREPAPQPTKARR